jgi:methyl-accepting chemotaxis protein
VGALITHVEKLAAATQKTSAGLQDVTTLGAEVRELITSIEKQGKMQADSTQLYRKQLEVSEGVVGQVLALTSAMTQVAATLQERRDGKTEERAFATLERIEAGIADMAGALESMRPVADETPA